MTSSIPPDLQGTEAAVFGPDVRELREAIIPALARLGYGEHMAREMGVVLVFQPSARRTQTMFNQVLAERDELAAVVEDLLDLTEMTDDASNPNTDLYVCRDRAGEALRSLRARIDAGATSDWRKR